MPSSESSGPMATENSTPERRSSSFANFSCVSRVESRLRAFFRSLYSGWESIRAAPATCTECASGSICFCRLSISRVNSSLWPLISLPSSCITLGYSLTRFPARRSVSRLLMA